MNQGTRRLSSRSNSGLTKPTASSRKSSQSDKVYYRLLTYNAPYNSSFPLDTDDDSLSFIHANRIPSPRLASDYTKYICKREGIHHTRAKLYTSSVSRSVYSHSPHGRKTLPDDPAFRLADPGAPLRLHSLGCGSSREKPLVLYLDLDPSMDRTHAALPISRLERGGRRVAKIVRRAADAVQSFLCACFGSLQKVGPGTRQQEAMSI
ncbi:uncharacterized protein FOMMEDRAFT_160221 [Fomitiporia mediterranea MF3/22]|uniref:uncharacterized protein n=1 Tax=Fomitiporia mediterranea (strain MF3/22) TaxID=694068 RepID=UPI000440905C|nr:uncharacterized protein FOMMEDRAFT_160221 [Fomitiporia mediterranea MF3/22]EJC99780.1 hypothetical protein FOMMEDRAFT_160221 [Fomitiporia mediterranea MF3/22]